MMNRSLPLALLATFALTVAGCDEEASEPMIDRDGDLIEDSEDADDDNDGVEDEEDEDDDNDGVEDAEDEAEDEEETEEEEAP